MGTHERGGLPPDLAAARNRFQAWRGQRPRGSRIPQRLWALAVRLVKRHGIARTATALRLDYYGLKKRAASAPCQPELESAAFIEVPSPILGGKQCLVELHNEAGASMRLRLAGYNAADLAAVACSLWIGN
jgi:hypothetical protein